MHYCSIMMSYSDSFKASPSTAYQDPRGSAPAQTTAKAHSEVHASKFSTAERKPLLATNENAELVYVDMKTWASGSRRSRLDRGAVIRSSNTKRQATPREKEPVLDADYDYTGLYAIGKRKSSFFIPQAPRSPPKREVPKLDLQPKLDAVKKRAPSWKLSRVKRFEYNNPNPPTATAATTARAENSSAQSVRAGSVQGSGQGIQPSTPSGHSSVKPPSKAARTMAKEDPVLPHVPAPRFRVATARDYGNMGVRLHHSANDAGPQSHKIRCGGAFYRMPLASNITACHRLKLC